jgi:hypothetical protein
MPKKIDRINMRIEIGKKQKLKDLSKKYFDNNMTNSLDAYLIILGRIEKICDSKFKKDIKKCIDYMLDSLESRLERGE